MGRGIVFLADGYQLSRLTFLQTRPELCEALPWFRCWQGAGHTHGGYLFGVLLDEDQGKRAYMDEHVVITRA